MQTASTHSTHASPFPINIFLLGKHHRYTSIHGVSAHGYICEKHVLLDMAVRPSDRLCTIYCAQYGHTTTTQISPPPRRACVSDSDRVAFSGGGIFFQQKCQREKNIWRFFQGFLLVIVYRCRTHVQHDLLIRRSADQYNIGHPYGPYR